MPDDKKPKPRFKERDDDADDDAEDRPRKKRRADDEADPDADDAPRKKKRRDDDSDDDDRPKKKRRGDADEPRVAGSERTPVLMMVVLLGSALALFACCAGGGWYSWVVVVAGGDFGGGGGGGSWGGGAEVVNVSRSVERRGLVTQTAVSWTVRARENFGRDWLVVVVRGGGQTNEENAFQLDKNSDRGGTVRLNGEVSPVEVWVERRANPVVRSGTRVSETKTVR